MSLKEDFQRAITQSQQGKAVGSIQGRGFVSQTRQLADKIIAEVKRKSPKAKWTKEEHPAPGEDSVEINLLFTHKKGTPFVSRGSQYHLDHVKFWIFVCDYNYQGSVDEIRYMVNIHAFGNLATMSGSNPKIMQISLREYDAIGESELTVALSDILRFIDNTSLL